MDKTDRRESIAIVGGGITGTVAAIRLAKTDRFDVTIFEKAQQLGGMSSSYKWQDVVCDRFYHVVLSTDTYLLEFIKELNLESEFFWCRTNSGFYGDGRLVSFSSATDFLKFPFLSLWQKFRLGVGILGVSKIKNLKKIDTLYAHQWLIKIFGQSVYQNFWEPLLRSKFGEAKDRISAAFIWATINRLYGARSSGSKQEKMGHVRGRYHTILSAVQRTLRELNVNIMINIPVKKVETADDADKQIILTTSIGTYRFDKVLFTVPCPEILNILDSVDNHPYWKMLEETEYIEVICVLLILKRKLSQYYVINLLDKDLPFTGIIEATNIVPEGEISDKHFVYLPKYLPGNDPIKDLSKLEIKNLFIKRLKKVFPDFKDEEILHAEIFYEKYVQPLQGLNFLERKLGFKTPISNVYIANTSQIYDTTLNNNAAIRIAQEAVKTIMVAP